MLLDTWAWVELFSGSPKGRALRRRLDGLSLFVSVLSLAELAAWCTRNGRESAGYLKAVKRAASVVHLDEETAEDAGNALPELRKRAPGIGMIDALLYAQAVGFGIPFLTGDPHFKRLEGVHFVN